MSEYDEWGRLQPDAEGFSEYERDQMQIIGERAEGMRREHPGAKGWASPPFITQIGLLTPASPYRLVDERWTSPGCIAIQAQGLTDNAIQGANFLEVTLRGLRQSALLQRRVRVFAWGMAFPFSAGQVQVDVQCGPKPFAVATIQQVIVFASISIGVPVPEDLPTFDEVLGLVPIIVTPPDFARTLTLSVLTGGPLVTPAPLAAGQSITMSAFPRTLTGPPGTHVSLTWGVFSP